MLTENLGVNSAGHLTIGGVDTVNLAKEYGTPLYVMDEDLLRANCRKFKKSIDEYYDGEGLVCYASKVFCCRAVCKIAIEEKIGLDVASEGELYTAISVGFPMDKICFHGNNKTDDELTLALSHGVGHIIVDNITELERLDRIARKIHKKANIMFRVKPGIDAHTHSFIQTGQIDSKFGLALETGEAFEAVKTAISLENVNLKGLHCHIGSQIFEIEPFELAAKVMLEFIAKIKNELGFEIRELDLGGGFGIKYLEEHNPPEYDEYMKRVSVVVNRECKALGINRPFILIEPGRSIAGPAGITLYTAGAVKTIPNIRTYVSVNGGMTDNPRYILYQAEYEALVANKANEEKTERVTLAGKCCESGDLIGENMPIQKVEPGDIIAVLATGAYNYSMSSNYNRVPKPPVVMVKGGKTRVAVKRETLEDIIRNDVV
ncbi:MAG: diaminopimelate decarboxylase [Oscillospiraceae bacterium]